MQGIGTLDKVPAPTAKVPDLLNGIEEVHKAVETVRMTTAKICELLRVGLNECSEKVQELAPQPPLITERCMFLSELRTSLYGTNERLQLVLETLREV